MKRPVKRILFWTPRILGILFAVFVGLFSLDVFELGVGWGETIIALLIHLIPAGVILMALAIAWRLEWLGGLLFIGLGALYLIIAWGQFHWTVYVVMSGPPALVGVLFLVNWLYRTELRANA